MIYEEFKKGLEFDLFTYDNIDMKENVTMTRVVSLKSQAVDLQKALPRKVVKLKRTSSNLFDTVGKALIGLVEYPHCFRRWYIGLGTQVMYPN